MKNSSDNQITCPHCHESFDFSAILKQRQAQMMESVRLEIEAENKRTMADWKKEQEKEIIERARKLAEAAAQSDLAKLKTQLSEKQKASDEMTQQFKKLKADFELQKKESLEKAQRDLADKLENEVKKINSKHAQMIAEKDKQINQITKKLENVQLSANQVSQQLKGEVFEDRVEELLKKNFPNDKFERTEKGKNGADILHTIRNERGLDIGSIYWEVKNTKTFESNWPAKLKKDMADRGATLGVIVSYAAPSEKQKESFPEDVYSLPAHLIETFIPYVRNLHELRLKSALQGNNSKSAEIRILKYFNSTEWKSHIDKTKKDIAEELKQIEKDRVSSNLSCKRRLARVQGMQISFVQMVDSIMNGLDPDSAPARHLRMVIDSNTIEAEFESRDEEEKELELEAGEA